MKTKLILVSILFAAVAVAQNPVQRDYSCTAASATGNDSYACNLLVAPANCAAIQGKPVRFQADVANTGAASLNLNSGACSAAIKKVAGGVTTDLSNNDIRINQWVTLIYDGTNFQMQSQLGNSGSSSAYDPMDMTSGPPILEGFWSVNVTTGTAGTHGWGITCSGSAAVKVNSDVANNALGIVSLPTQASNASTCAMNLGSTGSTSTSFGRLDQITNWDSLYRFKLVDTSEAQFFVGFGNNQTYPASSGGAAANGHFVGVRFDTSVSDTHFVLTSDNNSGAIFAQDTGVAADTNWHTLRVRSTVAGTILLSLDGGTEYSTTDVPTASVHPLFFVRDYTSASAAKTIYVDEFRFNITGMTGR